MPHSTMLTTQTGHDRFRGLPIENWPQLYFNWDTSAHAYQYTIDSPSGLLPTDHSPFNYVLSLGWASVSSIFNLLSPYSSQRDKPDLWDRGCPNKFARLLQHLSEGRPVSPPMLKVVESGHLFLSGGHHRYIIAQASGVLELPFYVDREHVDRLSAILPARWCDA